jgi:hypothetical protein
MMRSPMTYRGLRALLICGGVIAVCSAPVLAADSIKGVVRNQTRGRFAAGAEVILLRLGQTSLGQTSLDQTGLNRNMQEETRTKTDSQGLFTLDVRYPDKLHLVRVVHQGVNYDRQASAGDDVSIAVFDAFSKVQGVTGSIEIIRIGTVGNHLHISDMVEIKNDSSPPLTRTDERTFEAYLPAHAKIDSVLASGPGKIAVLISATPVSGEPGHYAVNFPLQPGATKFAFNYDLPYDTHATFRPKSMYALQQLAVMVPLTMKFTSLSPAFQVLRTGNDRYQVEVANLVKAGDGPGFEIWGVGALPTLRAQGQSPPKSLVADQPVPTLPGPISSRDRTQGASGWVTVTAPGILAGSSSVQSRVQWWVLGASAVMLGTCGFLLWRRQRLIDSAITKTKAVQKTEQGEETASSMVEAFKEELLQLEADRLLGTITGEEYASVKQALEGTVKRALTRVGAG